MLVVFACGDVFGWVPCEVAHPHPSSTELLIRALLCVLLGSGQEEFGGIYCEVEYDVFLAPNTRRDFQNHLLYLLSWRDEEKEIMAQSE